MEFSGACPSTEDLAYGRTSGATRVQNVKSNESTLELSGLADGNYGFAFILRQSNCDVLAAGCTQVTVPKHTHVTVGIGQYPEYTACDPTKNEQCVDGACRQK